MGFNAPGASYGAVPGRQAGHDGPLVVVFERDDSIAVPLLSHLRMAGYDVRGARTPVELFDALQKHPVALILIDLGSAATGRREFWVALDAQRRGRSAQVLTFRFMTEVITGELDFDLSARALADVEVRGPEDLQAVIDAALQRVPVNGVAAPTGTTLGAAGRSAVNPFAPGAAAMGDGTPPQFGGYGPQTSWDGGFAGPGFGGSLPGGISPFGPLGGAREGPDASFGYPSPFGQYSPAGASSGPFGEGHPGGYGEAGSLLGQPSAFASPAPANPFAAGGAEPSQFAQPFNGNPFGGHAPEGNGTSPFVGPAEQNPFAAGAPGVMAVAEMLPFSGPAHQLAPSTPGQYGQIDWNGQGSPLSASHPTGPTAATPARGRDSRAITDAWVPPGSEDVEPPASARGGRLAPVAPTPDGGWASSEPLRPLTDDTEVAFPAYDTADARPKRGAMVPPASFDQTAPVSATLPVAGQALEGPERALGTVLVEGALLSQRKLEVLKGIKQMLGSVDMEFKLGELALLFKFLSPDQLLAALLVSRGVVTPQQIAGLGRIKQELSGSGMDYDLETLLVMFHVLPAEELRELRKELM